MSVEIIVVMKYVMCWSCDEVVLKNVSLTCHLIYYDEEFVEINLAMKLVKMCWRMIHKLCCISCDEIVVKVLFISCWRGWSIYH